MNITIPGDKSISHRALMISAISDGPTVIHGLLQSEDVWRTADILRQCGVRTKRTSEDTLLVHGRGLAGLQSPVRLIQCGNSGTTARLMMGLLAPSPINGTLVGDESLHKRPMARAMRPLAAMGVEFATEKGLWEGGEATLPLTFFGGKATPAAITPEAASAQVKSAVLLAGVQICGETRVRETVRTRDHTERMLKLFGADIEWDNEEVRIHGGRALRCPEVRVPGDISSAVFFMLGSAVSGVEVRMDNIGINPTRRAVIDVFRRMGLMVAYVGGALGLHWEPVADLLVRPGTMQAVTTLPSEAPGLIDEFPALMVAAAFAEGTSEFHGLGELRHKESNRFEVMVAGLRANGVPVSVEGDDILIEGSAGAPIPGGALIDAQMDHRIAMAFSMLSLRTRRKVLVRGMQHVATSFPGFSREFLKLSRNM